MRNLVLLLVVANLLYFAWTHWGTNQQPMLTEVALREAAPITAPPAPPPCTTLGPFEDELLADSAGAALGQAGINVVRREMTAEIQDGWWVYVSSVDAAAQTRALAAIRRAGQRDAFAMPDDDAFRVSVGVFSSEERAKELATRIRGLQLEAVAEARLKQQPQIWFDVPGMSSEALGDGRLDDLDLPLLDLTIEACPAAP